MKRIINSKLFKAFLSKVPFIALLLIAISTNYYHFFNDSYSEIYQMISYVGGFSLLSIPAYFYILYKHNFCAYSKVALWGVLFYVLFNISFSAIEYFMSVGRGFYINVFEAGTVSLFSALSIVYLITENKK